MLSFVDTHSHIYLPDFDADRSDCIARSVECGVDKVILPNIDSVSVPAMLDTIQKFPANCFPLIGLHPTHVKTDFETELQKVLGIYSQHTFYGIGEIGIDLYWDKSFFEQQKIVFKHQVNFALENSLPVVIHARDSFDEIIQCLKEINVKRFSGIFHAFTGTIDHAHEVIEMGFAIGIGGVVTFKNSHLPTVVQQIDLNHIVLETDSPYLAPMPYRGKRNESSYIRLIAEKIAEIQGIKIDEVAEITTKNACSVFKI
jgi:TatD DNase family protein